MIPKHSRGHTYEVPSGKGEHLLDQRPVKDRMVSAFFEMHTAIYSICKAYCQNDSSHQGRIEYKTVYRRTEYEECHPKPQQAVKDAYVCVCGHMFMRRD